MGWSWQTSLLCIVRELAVDGLWLWLLSDEKLFKIKTKIYDIFWYWCYFFTCQENQCRPDARFFVGPYIAKHSSKRRPVIPKGPIDL